jgi:hypothetical protein
MAPSSEHADQVINPIDGLSLQAYVDVCRALVREGGDSSHRIEAVLARHGLTPGRWALVRVEWTERIRRDPNVRSEFQRLYAGPRDRPKLSGNE